VVISGEPVQLQLTPAFKLYSMGLIKRIDGGWVPRCPLYRDYFRNYFEHSENQN
jgi:AAA-like domain